MNTMKKLKSLRMRRAEAAHWRAIMRGRVDSSNTQARRDAIVYAQRLM